MPTPSIQTLSSIAIDLETDAEIGDFDGNSTQLEVLSENIRMQQSYVGGGGVRGTRSRHASRDRIGAERIFGTVELEPTATELDLLFPLILGAAESSDEFALAETIPKFGVLIDRITARYVYANCKVARATFTGQQGQVMRLRLDLEGSTETETATAFPGTVPAIADEQPYVMDDVTFSLSADASSDEVKSFEITIDNGLIIDRYMNSVTRAEIPAADRVITVKMEVPHNADTIDLHDQSVAGAAGTLTLTNGNVSTLFTFANLKSPAETPASTRRGGEYMLNLNMEARETDSTKELVVTHDADSGS